MHSSSTALEKTKYSYSTCRSLVFCDCSNRMYRQASHVSRPKSFLPSPAPEDLIDADSDLTSVLDDKRRDIEAEIELFRLEKEREFQTFEDELRSRKRPNPNDGVQHPPSGKSGLSLLSDKSLQAGGSATKEKKKQNNRRADDVNTGGLKPTLGPSKPSVSIDRVTINGMTTPPVSGTPPWANILSRSPTYLSGTPPRATSEKESTVSNNEDNFHGLFAPSYLQLLDAQPSSLPQNPTSHPLEHSKRSLTAPSLPSHSLPSALRTGSGTIRKRKHVTFRLAHSVVVDPSSSYEETPSPSENQDEDDLDELEVESDTESQSTSLPMQSTRSESNQGLASPSKGINDASFFSFDEELESPGMESPNHQDVSFSNQWFSLHLR
jgi:hypothetical protein